MNAEVFIGNTINREEDMALKADSLLEVTRSLLIKHPVRMTALLYLRDAMLQEKYEDCANIISIAREFGAHAHEIEGLVEDPRRVPRP